MFIQICNSLLNRVYVDYTYYIATDLRIKTHKLRMHFTYTYSIMVLFSNMNVINSEVILFVASANYSSVKINPDILNWDCFKKVWPSKVESKVVVARADINLWASGLVRLRTDIKLQPSACIGKRYMRTDTKTNIRNYVQSCKS